MARRGADPRPEDLLGPLEARIMQDLWKHGESSVGAVLERLNSRQRRQLAYNTVMSVMARLAQKGLLSRRRQKRAYLYTPVVSRDEFARRQAAEAAGALLDDFGRAAVAGFVDSVRSDPRLLEELARLVAEQPQDEG